MKVTINGNDYFITSWQDNKPVHILSTFEPMRVSVLRMVRGANGLWAETNIPCPTTIPVYNDVMKGCDLSDQNTAYYDARRRVQTRWQPRLDRRVFKTAIVNANILRNSGKAEQHKTTLLDFMKGLITQWCEVECPQLEEEDVSVSEEDVEAEDTDMKRRRTLKTWERDIHARTNGHHFPEIIKSKKANGGYTNPRSNCILCKRWVASVCQICHVHLCLKSGNGQDCFREFHKKLTF